MKQHANHGGLQLYQLLEPCQSSQQRDANNALPQLKFLAGVKAFLFAVPPHVQAFVCPSRNSHAVVHRLCSKNF